jgi:imidazolonepropionase-like amidohydrolase
LLLAFTHLTVIDATGAPPKDAQTVVVAGERIAAVGAASEVKIPSGACVVDARGKYLIPGLWDLHVHLKYATDVLPVFVAYGVTGIRELHSGTWGWAVRACARARVAKVLQWSS